MKNVRSRPSPSMPRLQLLALLLGLGLGMEVSSHAPALAPVAGGKNVGGDAQAGHIMRTESHRAHAPPDAHVSMEMLENGAMHIVRRPATSPVASAPGHPSRHAQRPPEKHALVQQKQKQKDPGNQQSGAAHDDHSTGTQSQQAGKEGFQERGDDWKNSDHGYEWKQDHDARDDTDDDDWDDEDTRGTVQDDPVGATSPGNGTSGTGDNAYGDAGDASSDTSTYTGGESPVVNVTSEEDASAPANAGPLKATNPNPPVAPPPENDIQRLGEGIGATAYERSPTGSRSMNLELRKRLQLQDFATIGVLIAVFGLTVLLSCCSVYQVADDPSPAAYYSEPKNYQQRVICESSDVDAFLAAFNTQPQNVRLRIVGRNPEPGGFRRFLRTLNAHTTRPRGLAALLPMRQRRRLSVLFDVALDLAPFITGDGRLSDENLMILQKYLSTKNRLETVLIQKRVDWALWEDVATNIRQRLRTLGFPGDVEVHFEAHDEVLVYQNHKWSNFVRNRVTQALVVISIFGSVFWIPYVWARSKTTKVETRFSINVDPSRYWELVSEGLSAAEGFHNI